MPELRVAELDQSIGAVFEDIELRATQCRFADCRQEPEPGCAVLRAYRKKGLILVDWKIIES
tara:strand:- start:306 stop:491 length:186 start_codon:yes stop_codon:yes gene_type:complete